MELIIDFYKGLDTLNLIIFWGIIIVIILLLIFSSILVNKNKKLKKLVANKNINQDEEVLPIKSQEDCITEEIIEFKNHNEPEIVPAIEDEKDEIDKIKSSEPIKFENHFVVEEHIKDYHKIENIEANIQQTNENKTIKTSIEMPTGPYQRNILREMSLSQTSPIGINRSQEQVNKKIELAKDLEESLQNEELEKKEENLQKDRNQSIQKNLDEQIKENLTKIENNYSRKTEIKSTPKEENKTNYIKSSNLMNQQKEIVRESTVEELLNIKSNNIESKKEKNSSEIYLEEVSRKLAEAEIPDEIERTDYELEQEENAIISYKELMEKKDSIQTIDEEDAIISIEELMERSNQKEETNNNIEEGKLYRLSDDEENDNFINELKQFRNDL